MLRYERIGIACVLHVKDDLDIASSPAVADMIRLAQHDVGGNVVLSLEKCAYVDSTGISVMIRAYKALGSRFVAVVPASSKCRRILEVCGLPQLMRVVETIDEALMGAAMPLYEDETA